MRYNSRLYWKPGPGAQYCQALMSWIVNIKMEYKKYKTRLRVFKKIRQAATWIVYGYMVL